MTAAASLLQTALLWRGRRGSRPRRHHRPVLLLGGQPSLLLAGHARAKVTQTASSASPVARETRPEPGPLATHQDGTKLEHVSVLFASAFQEQACTLPFDEPVSELPICLHSPSGRRQQKLVVCVLEQVASRRSSWRRARSMNTRSATTPRVDIVIPNKYEAWTPAVG